MTAPTSRGRAAAQPGGSQPFIAEAPRINLLLRPLLWGIERQTGQPFVPLRLMAWHTPTALGMLLAGGATWLSGGRTRRRLGPRILDLVALAAAHTAGSPYCASDAAQDLSRLEPPEVQALKAGDDVETVASFSARERVAIRYARLISATPLHFPPDFVAELTSAFNEPEIVILAATAADINYNARMFEALGVPVPVVGTGR